MAKLILNSAAKNRLRDSFKNGGNDMMTGRLPVIVPISNYDDRNLHDRAEITTYGDISGSFNHSVRRIWFDNGGDGEIVHDYSAGDTPAYPPGDYETNGPLVWAFPADVELNYFCLGRLNTAKNGFYLDAVITPPTTLGVTSNPKSYLINKISITFKGDGN